MTMKRVDQTPEKTVPPLPELAVLPTDLTSVKFGLPADEDMLLVAALRSASDPWKSRNETQEESLQALTKLRPFIQVGKLSNQVVGYVTIERDGPVPGAAYMRNIVVKGELRRKGLGMLLLNHGIQVAKDMHRKTVALRVDPANSPAVSFYRKAGFTTVATVVSKKSGKLRLLMSREL
ncbi:MAG: GNAT family N-acetyltransferase [Myxococcaceae bacterium]